MNKKTLFLIQQAGLLLQTPRSHVRNLGTAFDTVASHSHHASIIAYCLARMEKLNHAEAMKALSMAAFHDLAEGRTGDLDFVSKNYTKDDEEQAIKDQFKNIDFGGDLERLLGEYNERKTLVSKCAKDADSLAQMYHEWVLTWRGNKLAQQWFEGDFIERVPNFHTKSARQLAFAMKKSNPNEWWWDEFVTKDGKAKTKEHLLGKNYSGKKKK
ncbi:MAG: HD domain-containing protein [Candidatus Nealsonbacteria bacterium]|nr:HD domain-containing protein [Candidatus Nealsonbacteria bacterium]